MNILGRINDMELTPDQARALAALAFTTPGIDAFTVELDAERQRQLAAFGDQHHPAGTSSQHRTDADAARRACQQAAADGTLTWTHILLEEFCEAVAETDPARLRTELVQLAAVCAAWVHDLDREEEQ